MASRIGRGVAARPISDANTERGRGARQLLYVADASEAPRRLSTSRVSRGGDSPVDAAGGHAKQRPTGKKLRCRAACCRSRPQGHSLDLHRYASDVHAPEPPAGLAEVNTFSSKSTAAQNVAVGQETSYTESKKEVGN